MENLVREIFFRHYSYRPERIARFSTGSGNYVYRVDFSGRAYVVRLSQSSYHESLHWLSALSERDIPVPKVIASGCFDAFHYMILNYIPGQELNNIYPALSTDDKRTIAREVMAIQKKVAQIPPKEQINWTEWVHEMLERAEKRIKQNGYFEESKVNVVAEAAEEFWDYFESLKARAYLDDITTKNLLISHGHVSGIIDVDWMGWGDILTFAALTYMALRNLEYDTEYVDFLLQELDLSAFEMRVFWFYVLVYCVDFMGERGCVFNGRTVPVDAQIINRLNGLFDEIRSKL